MKLNPKVWGPKYWFFLHTVALTYPIHPTTVTKKKYYDFIQNFPLFIPIEEIGNTFATFLDKFPVTPYLDSRESFIKWVHFIHNKINSYLGQKEINMEEALANYYDNYKICVVKNLEDKIRREKIIYSILIIITIIISIILYLK